jgi:exopolysaccharide production protein ExoQ
MTQMKFIASQSGGRIGKSLLTLALGGVLILALTRPLFVMTGLFAHDEVSSARQISYIALSAFALIGAALYKGRNRIIAIPGPIILVLAWFFITTTWSISPAISIQKLALTSLITWLCFVTSDRINNNVIILVIRSLLAVVLFANYLTVIFFPEVGIHDYAVIGAHQWRGIMSHKNIAGMMASTTVLFFIFHGNRTSLIPRLFVASSAFVFLYFSSSRTSLIATSVSLCIGIIFFLHSGKIGNFLTKNYRYFRLLGYFCCAALLLTLLVLTIKIDFLIRLTSNPDFLSGRSQIWQPMLSSYAEHPMIGTGYGAFWSHFTETSDRVAQEKGNFFAGVTQGHNGYLDIAVQTGLIGLLVSIIAIIVWPIVYLLKLSSFDKNICSLTSSVFALFYLSNFTETSFFDGDQMLHVFAMIAFGMLQKGVRRSAQGINLKHGDIIHRRKVSSPL